MNAFVKKKQGSDNALENYFLDLVVQKKVIDREIHEILAAIEQSDVHQEYKTLLKRLLFGTENLYFQNWWTLQDWLLDALNNGEIRDKDISQHGIVLDMIVDLIERIFDIPDESMHAFVMLEERENVEHALIALMKKMLDHLEVWIRELIGHSWNLSIKPQDYRHAEFIVLQKNIWKLPNIFFETEKNKIAALQQTVFAIYEKYIVQKNVRTASSLNFSE